MNNHPRVKKKPIVLLLACATLLLAVGEVLSAPGILSLPAWTVDSGGGASQGGRYSLSGTIGQPDVGLLESSRYRLTGGLWSPEEQVELQYTIFLPIILR